MKIKMERKLMTDDNKSYVEAYAANIKETIKKTELHKISIPPRLLKKKTPEQIQAMIENALKTADNLKTK